MKKKQLEIILEGVEGFLSPNAALEQYITPAPVAAELLHFATLNGDLCENVYDLGCGTGILSIGAKILGAKKVTGFDIDPDAIEVANKNTLKLDVDCEFVCCDVSDVSGTCNTVIMNPPFGAQVKRSDRKFLKKAFEVGEVVYSIHNLGSSGFIKKFIKPNIITDHYPINLSIKRTFKFHEKDIEVIRVELYRMERLEGKIDDRR